jgi:DNA-binding LacI/PurR family transcriptional regulator
VKHLIEMGHRRIAIATGPLTLKNERRRLKGYKQALQDAGFEIDESFIWAGNLRPVDVQTMGRARLSDPARRPDAIFCTNGPTALGMLRALRDCRLRTPDDIAFATFDELTVDDLFAPSITTVVQPAFDIGYRAAEILLERIHGTAQEKAVTLRLPATLMVRASSARK